MDPVVIPRPRIFEGSGESVTSFIEANCAEVQAAIVSSGAVLLRRYSIDGTGELDQIVRAVASQPLAYSEGSSPRTHLGNNVYTSTDYPADQEIFLHNENSYQLTWPMRLFFHCVNPAQSQGATPLADTREILSRIDPQVIDEFRVRGWTVVRNFHDHFGLSWKEVFGTDDRDRVASYCANNKISCSWEDGILQTCAIRKAIHNHPVTGEEVWFNHATVFHVESLPPDTRNNLLEIFDEDKLPTNTYFGDGAVIPTDVIRHLRACYQDSKHRFDYWRGDVLIIDNMLTSHGREPFTGNRKIAVAMAQPASD
jgi:alpha-ketoglutarate-dependent taurine dioxygenase